MYLDNAASTEVSKNVKEKLIEVLSIYGNPSSQHNEGFKAKQIITDATDIISDKLNCCFDNIYYTSGATMSNNLAIQGFIRKNPNCKVLYSAIEHNDIILMANYFKDNFIKIPVNEEGYIDLCKLSLMLLQYYNIPVLVVIQIANGEIGTIQKIETISKIIHSYKDTYLYCDATQYIPYYKCNIKELDIDMLGMSGQKINCIKGIGLLYVKDQNIIDPIIFGEQGLIGGTENIIGIACLGEAFKNINYDIKELINKRDYFIEQLNKPLIGDKYNRLPNNICVLFKNTNSENFVELLNEYNIYSSAGSACSSGNPDPSHVLKAIGLNDVDAKSCMRFTINNNITYKEIDKTINMINKLYLMIKEK